MLRYMQRRLDSVCHLSSWFVRSFANITMISEHLIRNFEIRLTFPVDFNTSRYHVIILLYIETILFSSRCIFSSFVITCGGKHARWARFCRLECNIKLSGKKIDVVVEWYAAKCLQGFFLVCVAAQITSSRQMQWEKFDSSTLLHQGFLFSYKQASSFKSKLG